MGLSWEFPSVLLESASQHGSSEGALQRHGSIKGGNAAFHPNLGRGIAQKNMASFSLSNNK